MSISPKASLNSILCPPTYAAHEISNSPSAIEDSNNKPAYRQRIHYPITAPVYPRPEKMRKGLQLASTSSSSRHGVYLSTPCSASKDVMLPSAHAESHLKADRL